MFTFSFYVWWPVSFLVLLGLAAAIGRKSELGSILIDARGRYSLTHFQIVLWTVVILSTMLGVLISSRLDPSSVQLSAELLGLMGISAGSAVLSTGVKGGKDPTRIRGAGIFTGLGGSDPHFAQIWLEEEGQMADKVVNITKYQNFIFTLVILAFYISIAWNQAGLPELPQEVIWLIGISHAGYVGGKVPNKP